MGLEKKWIKFHHNGCSFSCVSFFSLLFLCFFFFFLCVSLIIGREKSYSTFYVSEMKFLDFLNQISSSVMGKKVFLLF